jgi:hypothetical protein
MEKRADGRPVHHYDTERHRVTCGSADQDHHSTKHARAVTCPACIAVLRERAGEGPRDEAAGFGSP